MLGIYSNTALRGRNPGVPETTAGPALLLRHWEKRLQPRVKATWRCAAAAEGQRELRLRSGGERLLLLTPLLFCLEVIEMLAFLPRIVFICSFQRLRSGIWASDLAPQSATG